MVASTLRIPCTWRRRSKLAPDLETELMMSKRIFITGAAGLVGQNLIAHMRAVGTWEIVGLDKYAHNLAILRTLHPEIELIEADCSEPGPWEETLRGCDELIMLHAQIGGLDREEFVRNNVTATRRVLEAAAAGRVTHLIHVSSSVINSVAQDFYVETKKQQEALVLESRISHVILRPTLMFGWFDRKHLGWLMRFMRRSPVFPVPGSGRYARQPLYAGDFAAIVASCVATGATGEYNISGLDKVDYIDLVRAIQRVAGARTRIVRIPYWMFWLLLRVYALFVHDPPFTTAQLRALVLPELFEVIDWPSLFKVTPTPLHEALRQTFTDRRFADVVLRF
jgi:nucleoside-diphosphate-sugar epimerase